MNYLIETQGLHSVPPLGLQFHASDAFAALIVVLHAIQVYADQPDGGAGGR